MTLEAGKKLGPYEILSPLGAGGMGEVYRARDTRLNREVAIKILPEHLAASAELQQRFEREAKAISQLTHPHICTLYDVGNEDGVEYLVMELLDGESLAERLTQGALPANQVLRYGIEIADALEAAHKHGIVHRDLKPANVMLTKAGVKLLDFGLAKHRAAATQGEIEALTSLATEMSPSQPLTTQGTIMGTFQYMAPEQLEGEETDERGDIFALGCVLYEMATGRKAFSGKSRASLIGSILKEEPPPISSIEAMTPPALDRLVQTCIAKDPEDRFQTAHDVKLQLQWLAEGGSQVGAPAIVSARRKSRERLWIALTGVFALLAIAAGVAWWMRAPETPRITRFNILPPAGLTSVDAPRISPDGRYIAFRATGKDGTPRIWLRAMDDLQAHAVPGTDGIRARPFWSPDSRYIGFVAGGKLKKVPVSGGPPQVVCDAPSGSDGAWSSNGVILFDGTGSDPIRRVSASGGVSAPIIDSKSGNDGYSVGWPAFLPDGEHFLYFQFATSGNSRELVLASLDGKEAPRKLLPAQSLVQYVSPGFLMYVREDSLLAQPFDLDSLKPTGEPVPLADKLGASNLGLADFSASSQGTLVYRAGQTARRRVVWVDRSGKEIGDEGGKEIYTDPAISPDGTHLAVTIEDPQSGNDDVWVRDLERGVTTRITFDPASDDGAVWSPDGKQIAFGSSRGNGHGVYLKDASGAGAVEEVAKSDVTIFPQSWSRDGRWLLCSQNNQDTSWDVVAVQMSGKERGKIVPFVHSKFVELRPSFSPNGRWVVYESWESGRPEIYVQPFPGPGGKWQISANGGSEPWWSADGKEIFYRSTASKVVRVPVVTGTTFSAGTPKPLFDARLISGLSRNRWVPAPDGKRFLLVEPESSALSRPMTVVLNWPQALKQR